MNHKSSSNTTIQQHVYTSTPTVNSSSSYSHSASSSYTNNYSTNQYRSNNFSEPSSPLFSRSPRNNRKSARNETASVLSNLFYNNDQCVEFINAVELIRTRNYEEDQNAINLISELVLNISNLDQQNNILEHDNKRLKAQINEIATRKQQQEKEMEESKIKELLERSALGRQRSTSMDEPYSSSSLQTSPRYTPNPSSIGAELPSPRLQKILSFSAKNSPPSNSRPSSLTTTQSCLSLDSGEFSADIENHLSVSPNPIAKRNSSTLHRNVLLSQSSSKIHRNSSFEATPVEVEFDEDSDSSGDDATPWML